MNDQTIKWSRVMIRAANPPSRETPGSAGYDLPYNGKEIIEVCAGEQKLIPTGWSVAIPDGWVGLIWPRSGLAVRSGLSIGAGVIDSDYRGEIKVLLQRPVHLGCDPAPIKIYPGDRIAQLVIVPNLQSVVEVVDNLPDTERGAGGFGSTGK